MSILVQVKEGQIEIHEPRAPGGTFRRELEAAQHLAERVARTAAPVNFHLSCSYPTDHGLPGFSKTAFMEEVKDQIYLIQQAARQPQPAM